MTFTKEQLTSEIETLEHFATNLKWTNVKGAQSLLFAAEVMRQALAGMEAESGEYMTHVVDDGYGEFSDRMNFSLPVGTKLYASPQPLTDAERTELENYRNAQQVVVKDHQVRELVNELRDIAVEYHGTQQLRERIARIVRAAIQPSISGVCGQVPSPELLCQFVTLNYANYQDAWLCGKSSEILAFLLHMSGHECEKVSCTIGGIGHLYVRCSDLNLDPSIKQFGDYPEISRGAHPCTSMNYVEDSTWSQEYRSAQQVVPSKPTESDIPSWLNGEKRLHWLSGAEWMHNTFCAAMQSGAVKDGWVMVPVEPTAEMISSGIAAHYERTKIQIQDRPAPGPMECAYVAMISAAPQQEAE